SNILTVILSMIPTSALAFDDVTEDSEYYNQIMKVSQEGIISGYEDNTFKGENEITRAEFSKMICKAFSITEGSGKTFPDVPQDLWVAEYIDALSSKGIINGYEDGTFKPDNNILVKEAVKMVVCAKNFGEQAEKFGGYPDGYFMIASNYKYLKDIDLVSNDSLTREQCAVILYNAMQ
ncbi:MAG: S-layer homology domain-containing protein, partial [Oscillospiraceae bacterium]|nr:S-layer homology domain-containing protein [Oscillospiraceae bacterium]